MYPAGTPADRPREVVQLFSGGRFRRSPVTDYRRAGSNTDESLENILRQAPSGGYPDLLLARPLDFLSISLRFFSGRNVRPSALLCWCSKFNPPVPFSEKPAAFPSRRPPEVHRMDPPYSLVSVPIRAGSEQLADLVHGRDFLARDP